MPLFVLRNAIDALDCFHHSDACLPVACCRTPFNIAIPLILQQVHDSLRAFPYQPGTGLCS